MNVFTIKLVNGNFGKNVFALKVPGMFGNWGASENFADMMGYAQRFGLETGATMAIAR